MTNNKSNTYFTAQEADLFTFYRIPKELITNSKYKHVCAEAKLLYGLQLDRNSLSLRNGWIDERGYIYIIFTREEAMEVLGIGKEKACELFKQLREVDLIEEVRQGQGKANIIYVKKFVQTPPNIDTPQKSVFPTSGSRNFVTALQKSEIPTSKSSENRPQEVGISDRNNTDFKETYLNENEKSQSVVSLPATSQSDQKQPTTDRLTSVPPRSITGAEQAALTTIYEQSQTTQSPAKDFVEHVIKKLYSDGNMPYILKMGLTHDEIRSRLHQLQAPHLERALKKSKGATNKELYFAKALLSAIVELALNNLSGEEPAPPPRPQRQGVSQRDNFEQREYSDEELERFYVNLTEER